MLTPAKPNITLKVSGSPSNGTASVAPSTGASARNAPVVNGPSRRCASMKLSIATITTRMPWNNDCVMMVGQPAASSNRTPQ